MKRLVHNGRHVLARLGRNVKGFFGHNPRALTLAAIMIFSTGAYTADVLITEAKYRLSVQSVQLIGDVNHTLANKLKLDKNTGTYRFNAESVTPEMTGESDPSKVAALLASQKQQTGGGGKDSQNLYALDLPVDPSQGTKVYDVNSKTSFKLIPEFEMGAGRTESGRVVYPINEGGQAVYTVKANGIKEDIVLQKPRGDELNFKYKLELPKTLEARLDDRGNLGIYSVDPAVSSAIAGALQNGASSTDTARLKDVQENGAKDYLTYLIPAPTIVQSGNQPQRHSAKAMYRLSGDQLTVETTGLEDLTYPISIDPSVVVTSTSDFAKGDNESNISFDVDAISRTAISGGTTGTWTSTTSLGAGRFGHQSTAYNGYMYVTGGYDGSSYRSDVQYAPINANGTIGAWTATTSFTTGRYYHQAVAYQGYLYVIGGSNGGNLSDVQYAPINANGTIAPGTWSTTASLSVGIHGHQSVAYNGYMYVIGGNSGGGVSDVKYAPINANGTIGTWTATTNFATARYHHSAAVYNGFLYIAGGLSSRSDVQYAPINANGTIGAWTATTSLPGTRSGHRSVVHGGYLYVIGGYTTGYSSDVQYAPINANGTIGAWTATTNFATGRNYHSAVAYKGFLYVIGGNNDTMLGDAQYAQINSLPDPALTMSSWSSTTILGAGTGSSSAKVTTRQLHTSEAYNGYLYLIGGQSGTTPTATVHYAPINANGTLGSYVLGTPLHSPRHGHKSIMVNDFIYVFGGTVSGIVSNTILYSQIGANGMNGNWTSITPATIPTSQYGLASHGNYLYVTGGGSTAVDTVYYTSVASDGSLGAWTASTALPVAINKHMSVAHNNFLYVVGGMTGANANSTTYFAPINANGTIGAWNTTLDLPGGGSDDLLHAYNGYMILNSAAVRPAGSFNDWNGQIRYAKVNPDGTLGAFANGTQYSPDRSGKGSAVHNGYIYTTGGNGAGTVQGDTQYAQFTFERPGVVGGYGTTGVWQAATATDLAVYGHASVVHNNFIYAVGGYGNSVYRNDVRYAPINSDGTIGTWVVSPNVMGLARFNGAAAVSNGYLYITGGQGVSSVSATTEYAPINSDGSIGAWVTSGNSFSTARHAHTTVAYNNKLYVVGGGDANNVALADVQYATINANGSIGAWSSTTATTSARDTDGFVYGGRLYILGGLNGSTYSNTIRYATFNADGTLGAWTTSPNTFADARSRHATIAVNGHVYISGGASATVYGDLQYAPINANGTIGPWKSSNSQSGAAGAAAVYYYHNMVTHNGRLYSIAGIGGTGGAAQATTYLTTQNAPALKAAYTHRINLGAPSTLNSIVMNGTLPIGQTNLLFRTAGSNGVYGSWRLPSSLINTPAADVQYIQYKIHLDDSISSDIFSTTGRSAVNDITVDYTLPAMAGLTTENRLKNNKYFDTSGVLQPLQTQ